MILIPIIDVAVRVTEEIRLEQALKNAGIENPASVTHLVVDGAMTRDDFEYIRENMGKTLQTLDASKATMSRIPNFAFEGCTGLVSVIIPDTVEEIGLSAFRGCIGLRSFFIPAAVADPYRWLFCGLIDTFSGCSTLTTIDVAPENAVYASVDGVMFNKAKTELIKYPQGKQGAYIIPDDVRCIAKNAFNGCAGLTEVVIPNAVNYIGENAFEGCAGLTAVELPGSVYKIGNRAFSGCSGLTSLDISRVKCMIGDCVFAGCSKLTSVDIPRRAFGYSAFSGCDALTTINILKDV